ncbi:dehydrodolichyl diphosphate synthase CPT3-like [Impatiens glandulifera]|uniref:dehydrodolichyl diphosphate synthase CPT3-like n=1 Tax=Impatiens glandulifera TaxID=253017 RepID=UPI001FB0E049|nr:dehydrodolichyl diphosphate synthase CPT3-like [Impatiens glandulifera]
MDKSAYYMSNNQVVHIARTISALARKCIFQLLSVGPLPNHIAFIMDGNRRYAKKHNLEEGSGHNAGFYALMYMLQYCYEFGLKYVTVYAFSIDNFKRRPEEVKYVMELMQEKIQGLIEDESMVNRYGVRVYFVGNLNLLPKPLRLAAERAMEATAGNSRAVLSICLAYTSTDEIVHAVQEACETNQMNGEIRLTDVERHMYMAAAPDPDIVIRTAGETRLSNFLLWQSSNSYLYSPSILWPEIGFRHLFCGIFNFQRNVSYLQMEKKTN